MFPIQEPLWICCAILLIILVVPLVAARLRFPQIAGLIVAGVLVGPGCIGLLSPGAETNFFSSVGLLFIMFFAGLEIDLDEMKRNCNWGLVFGILTFIIPAGLTFLACKRLFGMSNLASGVFACILGSHTLVSYPIISRYGQGNRKSVAISVSGALVAILLALITFTAVQGMASADGIKPVSMIIGTVVYAIVVVFVFPLLSKYYFTREKSSIQHFVFVLLVLAMSCGMARLAGLESILGAFLAGLALNRYIPKSSPLMNRLDFVGNAMFIPVFLLNTGMMINLKEISGSLIVLELAAVLFISGTVGKWLVALLVQKSCQMSSFDRRIIFGLSESHAAGALAIAMGAYGAGILENTALSATVLIVLFSCILSNVETERGARELHKLQLSNNKSAPDNRLLVVLTGSNTLQAIMDTALILHHREDRSMVGLYVTVNGDHTQKYMIDGKNRLMEASRIAASADIQFTSQNRLGNNIIESIVHAAKEFETNHLLMGLPLKDDITLRYYENIIRPLTDGIPQQIVLQRFTKPFNTIGSMRVLVPGPVVQDEAFESCMKTVYDISMAIGCVSAFYGKEQAIGAVRSTGLVFSGGRVRYNSLGESADMNLVMSDAGGNDLVLIIGQRDGETHAGRAFIHLYERIHFMQTDASIMIIYPRTDNYGGHIQLSGRTERDFLKMLRM